MQERSGRVMQSSKVWIFSLLGLLVVITGSLWAYRFVFRRPGEQAAALLPADAALVATLDVTAGPDQVVLFARIAKALKMEAVQSPIESAIASSKNGTTFFDEVVPHLRASYAAGAWTKPGAKPTDEPSFVGLAAVDNPATVEAIAAKHGILTHLDGLQYYSIKSEKLCIAFIKSYLVVSTTPEALARVLAVSRGEANSVTTLPSFMEARAKLPASANFMMFANMAKSIDWSKKFSQTFAPGSIPVTIDVQPGNPVPGDPVHKGEGWATFAMTLRNQGLETVWRAPYDPTYPGSKLVGSIAPIDTKLYSRLPSGPYGVLVFSQPGAYYEAKDDSFGLSPEDKKTMNEGLKSFEKETGLNIEKDLVAGLKGELTLAVYPGREAMTGFPDGLIMLDDANGADPSAMVTRIQSVIVAECKKNATSAPKFSSVQRNGAVVWTIDEKSQSALRDVADLASGSDSDKPSHANRSGASAEEKKQLLFATVGHSVLIASSESMLNRAIAAYNTGASTLATDPAYMSLLKQCVGGAQNVFMLAAPDMMVRLQPTLAHQLTDPHGPRAADVVKLFGARGNGLVFSQGHEGQTITGSLFVPLDYEVAIHLISLSNQANKQKGLQ